MIFTFLRFYQPSFVRHEKYLEKKKKDDNNKKDS